MKDKPERMALDDAQDAFMLLMRGIEAIDSGRVKRGRDIVWSAMGLLLEVESKLSGCVNEAQPVKVAK